ncbi:SRPBCC family protein [Streptomyces sp. 549]|uniref:SRPBCC family protein n=1 Tax=Streptomyces sp. 549 TaxID=3049076 RepID=UPI0024C351C8|nr:SRPBCC family protein [Streptomyces sp. 549]MDK1473432.1 SRPBCC family protein [Streptomyces sp. 549]
MPWNHYRFRSEWLLSAPPEQVFDVLSRPEDYPAWWPQVREARAGDDSSGTALFRSLLPYELRVRARATRQEPSAGVLEIGLEGDLHGWARWTVRPHPSGTAALFEQQVEVRRPLLRALALPVRPLLVANHAWMMRGGRRGLRRWLASGLNER